jgi:cysteinyl-tRNA synthetase
VLAALEDDLNTPLAIARLHELAGELNKTDDAAEQARLKGILLAAGDMLGLLQADPEDWFKGAGDDEAGEIEALIAARMAARKDRKFDEADRIRNELAARGITLEDGPEGTIWRRA